MKQFVLDCYEIVETDGYTDKHALYISTKELADKVAGTSGYKRVRKVNKTITVFDTIREIEDDAEAKIRASALAKLTSSERKVLGLE